MVRDILRGLYEGRYVSGQRLVEPDLVARYGVSRSTVRDAIKRLAAQGVVEARHQHGARIRTMSHTEAVNILLIAELLIGLAARQAAENIGTGDGSAKVRSALKRVEAASIADDRFELILARNQFHRTLAEIANNPVLDQTLANLHVHLVRNKLVMTSEERNAAYARIASAVIGGEAEQAETEARRHVRRMIELMQAE